METIFSESPALDDAFSSIARKYGVEKEMLGAELIRNYQKIIEPYIAAVDKNNVRTGFIKQTGTIGILRPETLYEVITGLTSVVKDQQGLLHTEFLNKLDLVRNHRKFDSETREQFNWMFALFESGKMPSSKVISALKEKGYFDIITSELDLDPSKKDFKKDMKEMMITE